MSIATQTATAIDTAQRARPNPVLERANNTALLDLEEAKLATVANGDGGSLALPSHANYSQVVQSMYNGDKKPIAVKDKNLPTAALSVNLEFLEAQGKNLSERLQFLIEHKAPEEFIENFLKENNIAPIYKEIRTSLGQNRYAVDYVLEDFDVMKDFVPFKPTAEQIDRYENYMTSCRISRLVKWLIGTEGSKLPTAFKGKHTAEHMEWAKDKNGKTYLTKLNSKKISLKENKAFAKGNVIFETDNRDYEKLVAPKETLSSFLRGVRNRFDGGYGKEWTSIGAGLEQGLDVPIPDNEAAIVANGILNRVTGFLAIPVKQVIRFACGR